MINSASDYRTTRGGAEDYTVSGQAMDTRDSLMQQVYQTGFAAVDAQLFLDTHPCDQAAMAYYQQVSSMYRDAVNAYTAQFGPLDSPDSNDTTYWSWISDPWPWEGGCV